MKSQSKPNSNQRSFRSLYRYETARFILFGCVNAAVTFALYALMLLWFSAPTSYTISYIFGIGLAYVLNSRFVFNVSLTLKKFILYPTVYLAQYSVGLGVLIFLIDVLGFAKLYASLATFSVTVPLGYILSRLFLLKRAPLKQLR